MANAPRISLIDQDTDDPLLAELFGRARGGFAGQVPNLYRTLGHAPELLDGWIAFAWSLRHDAVVARALRERVILRIAELLGSSYEYDKHRPMALEAGCTPEQLDALGRWRDDDAPFDADDRVALAVADRVAAGEPISAGEWGDLRDRFDERGCVEIVLTASFYVCVARVLDGLAIPLEADEHGSRR